MPPRGGDAGSGKRVFRGKGADRGQVKCLSKGAGEDSDQESVVASSGASGSFLQISSRASGQEQKRWIVG